MLLTIETAGRLGNWSTCHAHRCFEAALVDLDEG